MKPRGFTLIEVIVALFVIALGVGALLTTLVNSADTVIYLRDKSFAQWIAFNRLAEVRLATSPPQPGVTRNTLEYAGANWRWEQEVGSAGIGDLLRVDVRVSRLGDAGSEQQRDAQSDDLSFMATAIGFIGQSVSRPSGMNPEWTPIGAPGPGAGGGDEDGGRDTEGADDADGGGEAPTP
jgi:general secretion pathway protein I